VRDQDYTTSADFLKRLFGDTDQDVELRACPNERSGFASSKFTRDAADIEAFCQSKDQDGTGVYFGVCTRRDVRDSVGKRLGNQEAASECPALWVDIDCAKQGIIGDLAQAALAYLPHPPSIVVASGGGLHAYWVLETPADVQDAHVRDQVTVALRTLARVLAGDMACAEVARILRLPGTHNTKTATKALNAGDPAICEVLSDTGTVYDLDDLSEWLGEQRVVLHAKAAEARPVQESDPFVFYARSAGYEPALDIDAALAAMSHGAGGDNSIHQTQLRVSMSMIARGYDDDEIVARVLSATEAAAPAGEKWNWSREEAAIRKMVSSGRSKAVVKDDRTPRTQPMSSGNTAIAVVHDIEQERAKREPKAKKTAAPRQDEISILGSAALDVWQQRHGPIIHSRGTSYAYEGGVWEAWDERHDQILRVMMQEACGSLNLPPKTSLINAATAFFMNRPDLLIRNVDFDEHDLIIAGDGTIDPKTGETGQHSPDHRAMFKVGANLTGARECPTFLAFLTEAFADKPADEVPPIIGTVQEWLGACLVANKHRDLCKGMLVHGGSRTGKTQLSEILRALLGRGQTAATSVGDIGTDFGLQSFLGRRGWVADDAIGEGESLDAERYKKIVTGEEIGVRRKNRTDVQARFGFPVMLTANHLPRVKDQSDAVYNRSLVLPMTNVRPEGAPSPAGFHSISAKIIAEEMTGVLWWALEGWQRLSARGRFAEPECMKRAVTEMQENNNPVGTWIKECVVLDPESKVAVADLFGSFAGWFYQENGDGKFLFSQNKFKRRISEAMPQLIYQKGDRGRNFAGLRLNEDGLEYWAVNVGRDSFNAPKPASSDQFTVNQEYSPERAKRIAQVNAVRTPEDRTPRF
jgi:P4 family phage/plasmid primase-like protien